MKPLKAMPLNRQTFAFLICTAMLCSCGPDKDIAAANSRPNALAKLYPSKLAGLDAPSQKMAVEYATLWMKVFSILGTGGISRDATLKSAYDKELLPLILPLKGGAGVQNEAFEAGVKIHEALSYLGTNLREKKPFDNSELNALLRYQPGHEANPKLMSEGIAELFFDYLQLADPAAFVITFKANKLRERYKP